MNTANNNPKNQQAEICNCEPLEFTNPPLHAIGCPAGQPNQQAEKRLQYLICETGTNTKIYCQPSEGKDTLPKIKPKKIDIKKLEGIVERYNSEEKQMKIDKILQELSEIGTVMPNDLVWKDEKISEAKQSIKQLILESMPEKINSVNKFYGKSEIEWGFENTYNKAIDDVTKVIEDIFDGRE